MDRPQAHPRLRIVQQWHEIGEHRRIGAAVKVDRAPVTDVPVGMFQSLLDGRQHGLAELLKRRDSVSTRNSATANDATRAAGV